MLLPSFVCFFLVSVLLWWHYCFSITLIFLTHLKIARHLWKFFFGFSAFPSCYSLQTQKLKKSFRKDKFSLSFGVENGVRARIFHSHGKNHRFGKTGLGVGWVKFGVLG